MSSTLLTKLSIFDIPKEIIREIVLLVDPASYGKLLLAHRVFKSSLYEHDTEEIKSLRKIIKEDEISKERNIYFVLPNGRMQGLYRKWKNVSQKGEQAIYSQTEQAMYVNGRLDGERIFWRTDRWQRTLWMETNYRLGKKDGVERMRFSTGELREEKHWKADKLVGIWKKFNRKQVILWTDVTPK
jgi:antitoxin component YwqK of YwqJK toxin-antitoxin module